MVTEKETENAPLPKQGKVKEIMIRTRIPYSLYGRYKIMCIKKGLSAPKQLLAMMESFVKNFEDTERMIRENKDK